MQISKLDPLGERFLIGEEGIVLWPYDDAGGPKARMHYVSGVGYLRGDNSPAKGYPTIAVGHAILPHEIFGDISKEQAIAIFRQDILDREAAVARACPSVNQHQYNALFSFGYNCGTGKLTTSGISAAVNASDFGKAWSILKQFINTKGVVSKVLVARRTREWALFTTPMPADPIDADQVMALVAQTSDQFIADEFSSRLDGSSETPNA